MFKAFVIALCGLLGTGMGVVADEDGAAAFESLKQILREQTEQIEAEHDADMKKVSALYLDVLKPLEDHYKRNGKLEELVAIRAEMDKLNQFNVVEDEETPPGYLRKGRQNFLANQQRADRKRDQKKIELLKKYIKHTEKLKDRLVRSDDIVNATLVFNEIKKTKADLNTLKEALNAAAAVKPAPVGQPARPAAASWPEGLKAALLCRYSFEKGDGREVVDDSGSGRNAHGRGAQIVAGGARGRYARFTGNDVINLGPEVGNLARTIAFWFKFDEDVDPRTKPIKRVRAFDNDAKVMICRDRKSTNNGEFIISLQATDQWDRAGAVYAQYRDNRSRFKAASDRTTWRKNVWYHLVLTLDERTGMLMYIDGVVQRTRSGFAPYPTPVRDNTVLGAMGKMRYFTGGLDEVMFFDRALNPNEIQTIFHGIR
ncbi:MAG: LamG domain-containing protein [Verrucomicrobiota bacterium]